MIKVGLIGYGKAGQAVARVLAEDSRFELCWIARASALNADIELPVTVLEKATFPDWLDQYPVDAIVDFSNAEAVLLYGEAVRQRKIMLVSAISGYPAETLDYIRDLGKDIRVMSSPNITLGINFLMLAAKLLRRIAPFADIEIIEQHFREKPEISGTAQRIAETLDVDNERITSLRLGGIVGHHEVIFGFPYQTVRLIHNSIKREAFGTGTAFAVLQLATCKPGLYTFDDILLDLVGHELQSGKPLQADRSWQRPTGHSSAEAKSQCK
ncbi:MAG: dihydrodipicolinate reductase C-terminal domain-containing protein [Azonexus sp.]|nr:dihydrodipicolinate reductase C-terminal domain-containing protein [Azonexus sp.]MDP3637301.1 dihydrodipicolinate reductase C-terminal domain-containing protein [Azonexus sp.]MDZ4313588.1 dihydrodipicolinate reductase C-terminal domain-containing protein [Azonexus sp.]